MHIIFDLIATQPINGREHGGGEYGKVVYLSLLARAPDVSITAFFDKSRPLEQEIIDKSNEHDVELVPIDEFSDIQGIVDRTVDCTFYSALPYHYYDLDFQNTKLIFTIHGLRPVEIATDWYEQKYLAGLSDLAKWAAKSVFKKVYVQWRASQFRKLATKRAQQIRIVVPSAHTKYALLSLVPDLDVKDISVLYSPATQAGHGAQAETPTLQKYGLTERGYILLISGDRWVKNSYRALLALDQLITRGAIKEQVVVVGGEPKRMPRSWHGKFKFLPYVERNELVALFQYAHCFFYPTLNEGFGYPPLEAMRHGTPVLCSAITSTTEILGDAPIYFSPYSTSEMQNRVMRLCGSKDLWETKSIQSTERYAFVLSQQEEMLQELCDIISS